MPVPRQAPQPGVAGGPRVSSRAIKPPSRLVEAPEDLRLARAAAGGGRQGGGTKRESSSSHSKPRSRARVHGGGPSPSLGPASGMYAPSGLGGEHAAVFNMNRPFGAPFRGAPALNPLAMPAPSWSSYSAAPVTAAPPTSAPSARDA